ncbi:DsbA family protein [Roseobacter sp. S98]|uniref:DsbA family protein n=1 Tax=Roseobacter algicola (ex Choi et al. 2025) (nom. illeg.) TaxID=3092138 RepID=UPI0035C6C7CA
MMPLGFVRVGTVWRKEFLRRVAAVSAGALMLSLQSAAADMTDQEFEERVRTYLLAHPEIILEAMEALSKREARTAQTAQIAKYAEMFAEPAVLGIGPTDAALTVIEFFDYRCAPCKALHPKLQAALEDYPDIRVEMRHLPILSPGSERGARFALAVKNLGSPEQYRAVHEALWSIKGPLREVTFEDIARAQGLDWTAVEAEMKSNAVSDRISTNRDMAVALQVLGTPAFVTPTSVSFGSTDAEELVADWVSQ